MSTLRKIALVAVFSALALVAISLSSNRASAEQQDAFTNNQNYYFGFNTTVKPWWPAVDGLKSKPGLSLDRIADSNGCAGPNEARGYANLKVTEALPNKGLDVPYPLGTWMLAALDAQGPDQVTVSYYAKATGDCPSCRPMVYVGGRMPRYATDFAVDQTELSPKWNSYTYKTTLIASGTMYVGIGFNYTDTSVGFDCVSVRVDSLAGPAVQPLSK